MVYGIECYLLYEKPDKMHLFFVKDLLILIYVASYEATEISFGH